MTIDFSLYNVLLFCALICFLLEGLRLTPKWVSLFPMGFMFIVAAMLAGHKLGL